VRGIQAAMRCSPPTPVTRARPTATPSTLAAIDRFTEPKLAVEAARRSIRKLAFKAHEITVERHREFGAGRGLFLRRWPEFTQVPHYLGVARLSEHGREPRAVQQETSLTAS
jgi:hypothetical protein